MIIHDFILYLNPMLLILNIYAKFIRKFINRKKNIYQMHSSLIDSHKEYLNSANADTVEVKEGIFRIDSIKTP